MKKYSKQDQVSLAKWAADCAEHVLPFFEKAFPEDNRPRNAIETCRVWIRTGIFKMSEIRGASLSAHTAARDAKDNGPACFAARAAGQAVATAHVPQHAFGAAYYALKAVAAADPDDAELKVVNEQNWQSLHMPNGLEREILKRLVVQRKGNKLFITVLKDKDF